MVKIIKRFQGQAPENKILNYISDSETDGYSCAIVNGMSIPIDAIIDYDGDEVPEGYEEVPDDDYVDKYSYEEFKTNKVWVDGRPIYRKVYSFNSLTTLNIGTSNIADIVSSTCMIRQTNSGGHWRTLPWVWAEGTYFGGGEWSGGYFIRLDNYTIAFQVGSSLAAVDKGFLILEYTKTTD